MADNDFKLTALDRLVLSNQYRILEALYPDKAESLAIRREAIENGYEMLYKWDMEYICDGEEILTREESLEVWDTLDMFHALRISAKQLDILDWLSEQGNSTFQGYDGNNETKFMAFAAFTIQRLNRFQYLDLSDDEYLSSHSPMRPIYNKMLKIWKPVLSSNRFELSKEEIENIIGAQ